MDFQSIMQKEKKKIKYFAKGQKSIIQQTLRAFNQSAKWKIV